MAGLFSGLIQPNCTVNVMGLTSTDQDDAGGNVETYGTALATNVPCLVSLINGNRDGSLGGRFNRATGTLSGDNAALAEEDTQIIFVTGGVVGLVGLIAEVRSVANHAPSPDGWIPQKITLQWSQIGYVEEL